MLVKCVQVPNLKAPVGDFQKAKVECWNNVGPLKPKNAKPTSLVNGQVSRTIYNLFTQIRRTALQNCRPRCRLGDEVRPSTKDSSGAAAFISQKFYNLEFCQKNVIIRTIRNAIFQLIPVRTHSSRWSFWVLESNIYNQIMWRNRMASLQTATTKKRGLQHQYGKKCLLSASKNVLYFRPKTKGLWWDLPLEKANFAF